MRAADARFGIIPESAPKQNLCLNDQFSSKCYPLLKEQAVLQYVTEKCDEQDKCTLNVEHIKSNFTLTSSDRNLTEDCFGEADFFLQIPCSLDDDDIVERQTEGLFIGCMGVFIALFFVSYIDYLKSVFKSTAVEWDVKTITAGDYSVEIQITKDMWQTFLSTIYDPNVLKPKLQQFREYFDREMSTRLTNLPDLGFEDEPPEKISIALTTFAFDNSELINLLRERGSAIKFERFDAMRAINKKID